MISCGKNLGMEIGKPVIEIKSDPKPEKDIQELKGKNEELQLIMFILNANSQLLKGMLKLLFGDP